LIRASLPSTITIHQNIPRQGLMINADPSQVHQIIMNLFSNAGYTMMEEGEIRSDLPVILSSGFNDLVSPEAIKKSGIDHYIMKPYGKRDLAAKIREALDSVN